MEHIYSGLNWPGAELLLYSDRVYLWFDQLFTRVLYSLFTYEFNSYRAPRVQNTECLKPQDFSLLHSPSPTGTILATFRKGEMNLWSFCIFYICNLCHWIYCFSNKPIFLCPSLWSWGDRSYRLHFPLASWLDARPCQQRALERHCKLEEKEGTFSSQCFVFLLGGKGIGVQGPWQCFLERRMVLAQQQALCNVCQHTVSTEVWISALQGPLPLSLSSFLTYSSVSFRGSYCFLQFLL